MSESDEKELRKLKMEADMQREKFAKNHGRSESDMTGYGDITKKDFHAHTYDQDEAAGALKHRDAVPKEDRDKKRQFSKKQGEEAFKDTIKPPFEDDPHKGIDVTGREVSNIPKSDNFHQVDHILAHSRGGKSSDDNARSLDANANQRRGNKPLSDKHDTLFRRDYLE